MNIVKNYLSNGQYITQIYEKRSIVLHHTVGLSANGAWRWWNSTPERIGTPFIIDRDGTIIECFDPKAWAYHCGVKGDNDYLEKYTIGIELVSAGPLRKIGDKYYFFPMWPNKVSAKEIDPSEIVEFPNLWRGYQYFHKYTDSQIRALGELMKHLYENFPSLQRPSEPEEFYQYNEKAILGKYEGILSHTTVRADKSDIYPDERIIELVSSFKVKSDKKSSKHKT